MNYRENDQTTSRRKKLQQLRAAANPFPARVDRSHTCAQIHADFALLSQSGQVCSVAGRVRQIREHGGAVFLDLEDGTGSLQLFATKGHLGKSFQTLRDMADLGDFIEGKGTAFTTTRGERTLDLSSAQIIAKAVRPLPSQWHGLQDAERRYRQRELDLLSNPETRRIFSQRSRIIELLRQELLSASFMEVDTPVLQPIPGGATARPFITHHNALDIDLYLRIAPELYLKRLIVGGFEKVFEVARCFRNEGVDRAHNPEFTQIEGYWAYQDYIGLMVFLEKMVRRIAVSVVPDGKSRIGDSIIDWAASWPRIRFRDAFMKKTSLDLARHPSDAELKDLFKKNDLELPAESTRPRLIDELFKGLVRPALIQPTYLIDHPVELSPLAKRREDSPDFVERFQLIVAGQEIINAFSELNDPEDQEQRFREQEALRHAGDAEAHQFDRDFLTSMEYGMPPTAGFGLGIERFVALLTNVHAIKDVIFFPTLRPKTSSSGKTKTAPNLTQTVERPITRSEAWKIVEEFVSQPNLRNHLLAVEAAMRAYAEHFHEDIEEWGIVGLLHDFDYERYSMPEQHPLEGEKILAERGVSSVIRRAILAHAPHTNFKPETAMEKTIFAVDELAGFIVACALVTPRKSLAEVNIESIKKKLKSKSFAAKVNRAEIEQGWKILGIPQDEHIGLVLKALQHIHDYLKL